MTFISYAQNLEDVMLWRALKHIDQGFYVDVGAQDPIFDSVTQAFSERGWSGINIEPVYSFYERLCRERPLDINLPIAAGNVNGRLIFYEIPGTGLSTVNKNIAQIQRESGWTVEEREVSVQTLNQILQEHVNGPIHFLKIDVEGTEELVLQGLDLSHWRPWILVIEATKPLSNETNYHVWESYVLAAEYKLVYFDGLNRFYLAREHFDLAEAFKVPPNVFDNFMRNREVAVFTEQISLLNNQIQNLSQVLDEREQKIHTLLQTISARDQELSAHNQELSQVYGSKSWRITAPLRFLLEKERTLLKVIARLFPYNNR